MVGAQDLAGNVRVKGPRVDLGAFERGKFHYVWPGSASPLPPFLSWSNAAHTIQEAVAVAPDDDLVLVTRCHPQHKQSYEKKNRSLLNKDTQEPPPGRRSPRA